MYFWCPTLCEAIFLMKMFRAFWDAYKALGSVCGQRSSLEGLWWAEHNPHPIPWTAQEDGEELGVMEWYWTWEKGHGVGGRYFLLLKLARNYTNFPKGESVLAVIVTGKWPTCLYLDPQDFSYFLLLFCWGGWVKEQLGGNLALSQG